MGTKIKNHFRAENWIKIKPKMWFNQVRIILFYIIQIKIKLNVKPKMPHVSDQYIGGPHLSTKIFQNMLPHGIKTIREYNSNGF